MERINSFSLKVGDPIQILNRDEASFADMRNLARSAEATGTIEVKVKASPGHTLSIDFIRSQVQSAVRLNRDNADANINCRTSGFYYNEDDNLESTTVDMLIDKFVVNNFVLLFLFPLIFISFFSFLFLFSIDLNCFYF